MAIKSDTKILIIDDVATSRQATRQILHKIGLRKTSEASDGDSGLEILGKENFGLVLCELKVDKLNGLELFSVMKESPELSKIPFILSTGDTKRELILKANGLGIHNILAKPFSQQSLTEVLVKIFN